MKIILDTTISKIATATLFDGEKRLDEKTAASPLVAIHYLVKKHNLNLSTLDFAMKKSQGSFTGLRVGAAVVNTFNWLQGKKKLIFPTYD